MLSLSPEGTLVNVYMGWLGLETVRIGTTLLEEVDVEVILIQIQDQGSYYILICKYLKKLPEWKTIIINGYIENNNLEGEGIEAGVDLIHNPPDQIVLNREKADNLKAPVVVTENEITAEIDVTRPAVAVVQLTKAEILEDPAEVPARVVEAVEAKVFTGNANIVDHLQKTKEDRMSIIFLS